MNTRVKASYGLSELAYSYGYQLRRANSNLDQQALEWITANVEQVFPGDPASGATLKMLSLGCGRGHFDLELIRLCQRRLHGNIQYTGIDMNAVELRKFDERLILEERVQEGKLLEETVREQSAPENKTPENKIPENKNLRDAITLKHQHFDETNDLDDQYDLIVMGHLLYLFQDLHAPITNAIRHLAPRGRLLILQTSEQGITTIRQPFAAQLGLRPLQHSEQVLALLKTQGYAHWSATIDAQLCVDVLKHRSLDGLMLMSFCFAKDLACLDDSDQQQIRQAFLQGATMDGNARLIINEPMEAIIVTADKTVKRHQE